MGTAPSTDVVHVRPPYVGRPAPNPSGQETPDISVLEQVQAVQREKVLLCAEVSRLKLKASQLTTENQTLRSELEKQLRKKKESLRIANTDNKKLKEELERVRKSLASASTSDDDDQLSAGKLGKNLVESLFAENEALSVELRNTKKKLAEAEHRRSLLETNLVSTCSDLDTCIRKKLPKVNQDKVDHLQSKIASLENIISMYQDGGANSVSSLSHLFRNASSLFTHLKIKTGQHVTTKLGYEGTARFYGEVHFATGLWVGLELDRPYLFGNQSSGAETFYNGMVQGISYFTCKKDHGLFVRVEDIIDTLPPSSEQRAKSRQHKDPPKLSLASLVQIQMMFRTFLKRKRQQKVVFRKQRDNSSEFKNIDNYALSAPPGVCSSVETLAQHLAEATDDDCLLARAVFVWIATNVEYDTKAYFSGMQSITTAHDVLQHRKAMCGGFSDLFQLLAIACGLQAERISGYTKSYSYRSGDSFKGKQSNHAWNAVKINSRWQLLDVTWAAGYVNDGHQFVRRFSGHYFLTPPEEFILDHFPENPQWQLLAEPVKMEQYELMVKFREPYFELGLQVVSNPCAIIEVSDHSEAVVQFKNKERAQLTGRLYYPVDEKNQTHSEVTGGVLCQTRGIVSDCLLALPKPGQYELKLFGRGKGVSGSFDHFATYTVICTTPKQPHSPFPEVFGAFQQVGGIVDSPLEGILCPGRTTQFRLLIPDAVEVVVNPGWKQLKNDGHSIVWENDIVVGKHQTEVAVFAKFSKDAKKYTGLLRYAVQGR